MRDLWLSSEQVRRVTGWSDRTLRLKAGSGELTWREASSAARGRKPREYSARSLPASFHQKVLELELAGTNRGEFAGSPGKAMLPPARLGPVGKSSSPDAAVDCGQQALFAPPNAKDVPAARAFEALTDEQQRQARERLAKIQPMLEWADGAHRVLALQSGELVKTLDDVARWLAEQNAIGRATIFNWYSNYKKHGLAALADKPRSDRGVSKFFLKYPNAKAFVENKYLNERISIQSTHEALVREWPRLCCPSAAKTAAPRAPSPNSLGAAAAGFGRGCLNHGSQPPSYETVRAYLASLSAPVVTLARQGEKAFNEQQRPFLLRDYRTLKVNELWVSDHMQHDVFVYNDAALPGLKPGQAFRPYLTDFMDVRTRKIVGFAWSVNPSSESICSALRVGICQFGIPRALYTDNGKDYKSQHLDAVLRRLNIEVKFATPYHAQAKPNESWHATLHKRFDQKMQPAYCGPDAKSIPDECRAAQREHQDFLDGKQRWTPLMPASEFFRIASFWIIEEYNATHPHRGQGMGNMSPDEVFDREIPKDQRRVIDPRQIAELFWKREPRKLQEAGTIWLDGRRYEPADGPSFSAANLLAAGDRDVLVACDPLNVAEAIVYRMDGAYLGLYRASEMAAWGPVSQAQITETRKMQRHYRKAIDRYREGLAYSRAAAGDLSERDRLRAAAGLPVGSRVVTPDDPMFHEEPAALGQTRAARRLPAAVGSDLAPHIEDVAEDFLKGEEGGD